MMNAELRIKMRYDRTSTTDTKLRRPNMGYTVDYETRDGLRLTKTFPTLDHAQRFIAVQKSKGLKATLR